MADREAYIKFRAETKEFTAAIKSAESSMSTMRSQLKLSEAEFKNTGDKVKYLEDKEKNLTTQLAANREKQEALNSKLEVAKRIFGEESEEVAKLERQLNGVKSQEQNLQGQLESCTAELKQSKTATGILTNEISKQETHLEKLKSEYMEQVLAKGKDSDAAKKLEHQIKDENSALEKQKERLAAAEQATDALTDETKELGDATNETAQYVKLSDVVWGNLVAGGISTVINKSKEAAKEIIATGQAYETSMSKVAALSGATGADFDALSAKAREMGATTTFSASESADALGYMALAGWDTQSMIAGLPGVLSLAQAGEMDLAAASDLVTDYLSAFNMTADETGRMVDVLAYAQANANTTTEGLGNAFKNCAANANAAGLDVETTSAAISMMANQGLKGEKAGTALTAVLRDMTAKMKDGKIAIGEQTVAVMDAEGNYRDFTQILADVEAATNGMGDAERAAALQSTFTADSIKGLNLMLNAGSDEMVVFRDELYNCEGAAKATADTMTDNLGGDLANFNSALEETELQLYDSLQEPLRAVVQLGTNQFMPMLQAGASNLDKIVPPLLAVSAAIAAKRLAINALRPTLAEMGVEVNKLTVKELEQVIVEKSAALQKKLLGTELKGLTTAEKARTVATRAGTVATRAAATAMTALKAASPYLAIMLLVEGAVMLAEMFGKAAEQAEKQRQHQEKLTQATDGLRDAASGLGAEIKETNDALEDEAEAVASIDLDALIDKHVELANSLTRMKSEALTSQAQLSDYANVIDELGGRSDLTADEAARLELALKGVNESCGTNYEVVQDASGAYQIMADGAIVAKDAILQVVEAQKYQIEQEALLNEKRAVYAQLREDNEKLAEAQKAVTAAQEDLNAAAAKWGDNRYIYDEMGNIIGDHCQDEVNALADAKTAYAEVERQLGSTQSAYNRLDEESILNQMAMAENASAFIRAADGCQTFKSNVLACGVDLVNFTQSLESMGFTAEQVSSMSAEQVQLLATAWNDGSMSMIDACNQAGIAIPSGMAAASDGFSAHAQEIMSKAAETSGITAEQFSQLAGKLGVSGEGAMIALANGIRSKSAAGPDAARIVKQAIVLELCAGDVEAAAEMLGCNIDEGLAAGISGSAEMPAEAVGVMSQSTIDAAKAAFESHSPSQVMHRLGNDVDAGLANGITGNQSRPTTAMSSVGQSVKNAVASLPSDMTSTGDSAGAGLASGIQSHEGDASVAGHAIRNAAERGVDGLAGNMGAEATDASARFASGVSSSHGAASANADSMAQAASRMNSNAGRGWEWGHDLGSGLANGIRSAIGLVSSGATAVANAIRSVLHFSVPDEGPLADADEYGPDFAELLARGIEDGAPKAKRAAMGLAREINDVLRFDRSSSIESGVAVDIAYLSEGLESALSASAWMGAQAQVNELESIDRKLDGVIGAINDFDDGIGKKIAKYAPDSWPGDRDFRKALRMAGVDL